MYVSDAITVARSRNPRVVSFLFVRESEYQQLWYDLVNNHRRMLPEIPARRPNVIAIDKHLKIHAAGTNDLGIVREANRQAQEDYEKRLYELRIGDESPVDPPKPAPYMTETEIQEELNRLSPRNEGYFEK